MKPKRVAVDVGIVLVVFALTLVGMVGRHEEAADFRALDGLGAALAALGSVPLLARRRAPLAVFAVTAGAAVAIAALGYMPAIPVGATVAVFQLGTRDGARTRLTAATVLGFYVLHLAAHGLQDGELPVVPALFGALVWGGAWVLGDRVRLRRERVAAREERTEREQRLAVAEERTRIARDLHDSAGHAINVILVQAGAARLLAERDPDRSRAALETIEEVARETVAEIDQLVRALRENGSERRDVEPPPGLAALDTLVERHRAAGLDASVRRDGLGRPLPPAVDQAAYRIVREALTNATRHGRGTAEVEVRVASDAVEIAVTNPVGPETSPGGGHGIVGMRERAALLGGSVETESSAGVFRLRARLPVGGGE